MDFRDYNEEFVKIEEKNELRFVINSPRQEIILQLTEGSAEVFGSKLFLNECYKFVYFCSVAVFSESGCILKIKSSRRFNYKVKSSSEVTLVQNLHNYLESSRLNEERNETECPVTLITGPTDVGKSTLCRYLLNYAAQHGRRPIFIDLDVGQTKLSLPGTFNVLPVQGPSDVNGKFDQTFLAVYFFGYKSPGHNMALFKKLLKKLGTALKTHLSCESAITKKSGVIIDTCGWVEGAGYKLILDIIKYLDVNTVFAVGSNSLHRKLKNDLSVEIEITHISSLEGTVTRQKNVRCDSRAFQIHTYFYGFFETLKPFFVEVQFSEMQIYKAKSDADYKNLATDINLDVVSVPFEPSILNQVLALSYAENIKDILLSSIYGFVCLIAINMDSKTASVLSPKPGPLPTQYFLMGDMTYALNNVKDNFS